jgi:hypothetical protein
MVWPLKADVLCDQKNIFWGVVFLVYTCVCSFCIRSNQLGRQGQQKGPFYVRFFLARFPATLSDKAQHGGKAQLSDKAEHGALSVPAGANEPQLLGPSALLCPPASQPRPLASYSLHPYR